MEHDARLDDLLNHIQQRWGTHALRPLRSVTAARPPAPTGFAALDSLLGGGVPAGQVTELLGRPTSGVTTLAYSILARGQSDTAYGIAVDLTSTFDPDYASQCGVRLDRLFLVRPDTEPVALDIARELLADDLAAVIMLDTGHSLPDPQRLYRLRSALARSGCVVLSLASVNPSLTARGGPAALRLLVNRQAWLPCPADAHGCRTRVTVLRHPTATGRSVDIDIDFDGSGGLR